MFFVATNFRDWLIEQLEKHSWTYEGLGEKIGVSHGAVGGWVRGRYLPDPTSLKKLAEVTGVEDIWLFRLVGYLASEKGQEISTPEFMEWSSLFNRLNGSDQEELLAIARVKAKRGKGEKIKTR